VVIHLPIYSRQSASTDDFIKFWANQVSPSEVEKDNALYMPHINKRLTPESLEALFKWKNQMRLSEKKRRSLEENYIAHLATLQRLQSTTTAESFLDTFKKGGAIWRIFLLHCWSQAKYPIYDQHVHRAMTFIQGNPRAELSGWNDQRKIEAYLRQYVPFFNSFGEHPPRQVDRALMVLGQFIKTHRFPDVLAQGHG
jgi:hypothetical protein